MCTFSTFDHFFLEISFFIPKLTVSLCASCPLRGRGRWVRGVRAVLWPVHSRYIPFPERPLLYTVFLRCWLYKPPLSLGNRFVFSR